LFIAGILGFLEIEGKVQQELISLVLKSISVRKWRFLRLKAKLYSPVFLFLVLMPFFWKRFIGKDISLPDDGLQDIGLSKDAKKPAGFESFHSIK
jgi:hypothetical protein